MKIDLHLECTRSTSARAQQLSGVFDVPFGERTSHFDWTGDVPIEAEPWTIGLLLGPSGSGKSSLLRHLFGDPTPMAWSEKSVIDDFPDTARLDEITSACQAVGFNTIPAWMRPYAVLSTGEKFRVEMARRFVEGGDLIVVDEFTSTVDRQVATITCHAVQKYIRRSPNRRFVAASCHFDVVDWLQPDWIIEPATMTFVRRSLQRRPTLHGTIRRTDYSEWALFARYHYLTAELNSSAACFVLEVEGQPAAFAGVLHKPISTPHALQNLKGLSRLVTLPDYQGLGLAFMLSETLGACYRAVGYRFRNYPAHPPFARNYDKRPQMWQKIKSLGDYLNVANSSLMNANKPGRPCAIYEYCGPPYPDRDMARKLIRSS